MHRNTFWSAFRDWLSMPLGQNLVAEQTKKIEEFIQTVFGYHIIFLGEPPLLEELRKSPILHRVWIHPEAKPLSNCTAVISRQDKLPLIPDEIDLIYLAHCLEFNSNPHEVLREAYAALKPEGHLIISGFNPWSTWGFWRYIVRYIKRAPWDADFISLKRLKDWLALLGFDIVQVKTCFFRPPIEKETWLEKISWFEKLGGFLFPFLGASYIVMAKKRVIRLTPLRVEWNKRRKLIPTGLAEPVIRTRTDI